MNTKDDITPTAIIMHGSFGTPSENWFPWLAEEVRKLGINAIVPSLPTPENQDLDNWLKLFKIQVGELKSNYILIGHSLAPGFILNLLERSKTPVIATFMVSGFIGLLNNNEFDDINRTFVNKDFNWKVIRQNAGHVFVYNSDNDPYVPIQKGIELANNLGAKLTVIKNGGHINSSSGYTTFPKLLKDLKQFISIYHIIE